MLDKETYLKVIELKRKQYEREIELSESLGKIISGFDPILTISEYNEEIFSLLMDKLDKGLESNTSWYLYELGGIDGDILNDDWTVEYKTIKFSPQTPSDIYDLSMSFNELDKLGDVDESNLVVLGEFDIRNGDKELCNVTLDDINPTIREIIKDYSNVIVKNGCECVIIQNSKELYIPAS